MSLAKGISPILEPGERGFHARQRVSRPYKTGPPPSSFTNQPLPPPYYSPLHFTRSTLTMRAFDDIYVHPSFSPSPEPRRPTSSSSPNGTHSSADKWQYAVVGTAVTMAVASGVGVAVGMPGIFNAYVCLLSALGSAKLTICIPVSRVVEIMCDLPTCSFLVSHTVGNTSMLSYRLGSELTRVLSIIAERTRLAMMIPLRQYSRNRASTSHSDNQFSFIFSHSFVALPPGDYHLFESIFSVLCCILSVHSQTYVSITYQLFIHLHKSTTR